MTGSRAEDRNYAHSVQPSPVRRVERIGEYDDQTLKTLFDRVRPAPGTVLLIYEKDGKIICDRTDTGYFRDREQRRAEAAFKNGITVGKADVTRTRFHDGYFAGYADGSEGRSFRDPDAPSPEDSVTTCDFKCRMCVHACETCGHCTYYDRPHPEAEAYRKKKEQEKAANAGTETDGKEKEEPKPSGGFRRRVPANKEETAFGNDNDNDNVKNKEKNKYTY